MLKLINFVLLAVFVVSGTALSDDNTNQVDASWFPVGEKISYRMYWGFIAVGKVELTSEWKEVDGRRLILLRATARTTSIVAKIYPVKDVIVSYVDPSTFLPLVYTQKLREGRHRRDDHIAFDRDKGVATWKKLKDNNNGQTKEIAIDKDIRDVLCLVYYMRKRGFEVGQQEFFKVLVDDKIYDLEVVGVEKETQNVRGIGKIKCLKVEPKAKFGGIFVRKGTVNLWFSLDPRHMCVRMSATVPLADLKAVFDSVEGVGDDIWSGKAGSGKDAD